MRIPLVAAILLAPCLAAPIPGLPAVPPAAAAGEPAPGDLSLGVRVEDAPAYLKESDPPRVSVALAVARTERTGFEGAVRVDTGSGSLDLPFDLLRRRTAELRAVLPLPLAADGTVATFPVEVLSGKTRLLAMDLRLARTQAWWVAGPFPGGVGESHEKHLPPESSRPSLEARFPVEGGAPLSWEPVPASARRPDGVLDLGAVYPRATSKTAYLLTRFRSDRPKVARLLLGSDDSLRLWWNGEMVLDSPLRRACSPGEDRVGVVLQTGENTLLAKVCQDGGNWAFSFSMDDEEGEPLRGVTPLTRILREGIGDAGLHTAEVGRASAAFTWRTADPVPSRLSVVEARPGRARPVAEGVPRSSMVLSPMQAKARIVEDPLPCTTHRLRVEGLEPGSRYLVSALPGPAGERTGPLSFRTGPPEGRAQVLRLRVAVAIFANAVPEKDAALEGARVPVPAAKVEWARRECGAAAAFVFRNSGMRLWLDDEFLVDDSFHAIPEGSTYGIGLAPGAPHEKALRKMLGARNEVPGDYDALAYVTLDRHWDGTAWVHDFSGGGTFGPDGPLGVGNSSWKGGHDCGWLYAHEVGHQVDALYEASGMPEFLFNHFQPWDGTAHRHGEHFDGNAWLLREWAGIVTREHPGWPPLPPSLGWRYGTCRWGEAVLVADADGDGVPDDAPELPLDEKRLGSDPTKRDTDGDGLDDMGEALAIEGVEQGLQEVWAGPPGRHRCDPRNPDSDGDGLKDGEDPEPLCAASTTLARGTPTVDGLLSPGEWRPFVRIDEPEFHGSFHLAFDAAGLHIAGRADNPFREVRILVDADDDGWFTGHDNLRLLVNAKGLPPDPALLLLGDGLCGVSLHDCAVPGKWPFFEPGALAAEGFAFASRPFAGGRDFEVTLRRDPALGLELVPGERMGIQFAVLPEGGLRRPGAEGYLTPFEPHRFFRFALGE